MSRITIDTDDLRAVPEDVRLRLAEALWDSLEDGPGQDPLPLSSAWCQQVRERIAWADVHPQALLTIAQVEAFCRDG